MGNYQIFTDSACDISLERLAEWGVECIDLTLSFTDDEVEFEDHAMPKKEFYDYMRNGRIAKTSAANADTFNRRFSKVLTEGTDVFYLAFSSGLSSTFATSCMAAEDLMEEYPGRKVITVDSLAASSGYGLLLYLVTKKRDEGATIEELAQYAVDMRQHIVHHFTVESLEYLKRGGRISAMKAAVGGLLNIKPMLLVDEEGHLIGYQNVRGRKMSIDKLASVAIEESTDFANNPIFISHGDCIEDANFLASKIKEAGGNVELIEDVGPVIGAHSGPGTLTVFFVGEHR